MLPFAAGHGAARPVRAAALALLAFATQHAAAVNKCTGRDGAVVYQDAPCTNAAVTSANVKTWSNSPGTYHGTRDVQPDIKLAGPVQAAPLVNIYRRWIDAERLAMATGRIALAGPVASLQALQREAESVAVPACVAQAKVALVEITSQSTHTMLQFMHRDELAGLVYRLADRPKLVDAFERGVTDADCR